MNLRGASAAASGDVLLRMGAAAGLATALTHLSMPPGGTVDRLPGGVLATLTAPAFLPWLVISAAVVLLVAPMLQRELGADRTRVLLQGAVTLLAIAPGHSVWFRCPVWFWASAAAAVTCWRLSRLAQRPAVEGRSDPDDSGRRAARLAAAVVLLIGVCLALAAPPTQGDEPHYLLVAHSLWQDADLDLADDYGAREDLAFHRGAISPHYKPGVREGSRYSMHGLGYPLLLLPEYALGRALFGGEAAVLLARLLQVLMLAATGWILVRWIAGLVSPRAALWSVLLTLGLAPAVFAPVSLFPETAAMLLACGGFVALRGDDSGGRLLAGGVALALLPWLGVKYIPLAGAVAVGGLLARGERPPLRPLTLAFAPLVVALLGHAAFTWALYGSLSPSSIYLGADPGFGRQPGYGADWWAYVSDWPGALRAAAGYFFDQKEGLFLLAPHFLLVAGGLAWAWRRGRAELVALGLIAAAHLGPYALSQQIGGQSPPGRPLMAVIWVAALPLAGAFEVGGGRLLALGRGALPALGGAITLTLMLDPGLLPHDYPVTEAWLWRDLSPAGSEFWRAFPLWLNLRGNAQWLPTLLWTGALVVLLIGLFRSASVATRGVAANRLAWRGAAVMLAVVAALAAHSARLVVTARHVGAEISAGVEAWVVRSVPEAAWAEPGGVWISPGRPREVLLVVDRPPAELAGERLDVRMRTLQDATVRFGGAGVWWAERIEAGPPVRRELELGWPHPWRGRSAYRLLVGVDAGIEPARLDGGGDWRPLGVFVQVVEPPAGGGEGS